jgi:hypothetical protein
VLLGREGELRRLESLLATARTRRGGAAVLEGPAGIGKTVLLAEASVRAEASGFRVWQGAAQRAEAHGRAARLLAERGAPVAQVASHLMASQPSRDEWVVGVLRAAAREATFSGAPGSSVSYLERALEESRPPAVRAELLLELGEAQQQAGLPGATARIRDALALCMDVRRRAEISLVLGRMLLSAGDETASEAFLRGLAELPDGADDELAVELRGWHRTSSHAHAGPDAPAPEPDSSLLATTRQADAVRALPARPFCVSVRAIG